MAMAVRNGEVPAGSGHSGLGQEAAGTGRSLAGCTARRLHRTAAQS